MGYIDTVYGRARANPRAIAFVDGANELVMGAAARAAKEGVARPVLIGEERLLRALCAERGHDPACFLFADVDDDRKTEELVERFTPLPESMLSRKGVAKRIADPLYRALIMEALGEVDATFAGFDSTTGDVVLGAQTIIGLSEEAVVASSFGLVEVDGFEGAQGNLIGFGDSTVCVNPSSEELADIAIACCDSFRTLVGRDARCALLSYSTCGSASGDEVSRVADAVARARLRRPDLAIDGEFQLDAAVNEAIAAKKVKRHSEVAGRADLLVWPSLGAGNIGIKLMQQFGSVRTYGAFLQGFRKPVCELSRGDTAQTLLDSIAFASVLAADATCPPAGSERPAAGKEAAHV